MATDPVELPFAVGDSVWAHLDKPRHAVVLLVKDERALVVFGTGTERDRPPFVPVGPRSRWGTLLGLTKQTFFYARDARWVTFSHLQRKERRRCPPDLFNQLRKAWGESLSRRAGRTDS